MKNSEGTSVAIIWQREHGNTPSVAVLSHRYFEYCLEVNAYANGKFSGHLRVGHVNLKNSLQVDSVEIAELRAEAFVPAWCAYMGFEVPRSLK